MLEATIKVALKFGKVSTGVVLMLCDKSQIYMRFTLVYLVFCIVITYFGHFYVCFYLVGDVQVERSKNEQRVAKRSQKKQKWAKHESMSRHGFIMPQHELHQSKTRG